MQQPERSSSFAEEWSHIGGHKPRIGKGVFQAAILGLPSLATAAQGDDKGYSVTYSNGLQLKRNDGMFKIKIPNKIGAGEKAKCKLQLSDNTLDQSFEKSFTIQLDDTKQTRFTIPVKRQIRVRAGSLSAAEKK